MSEEIKEEVIQEEVKPKRGRPPKVDKIDKNALPTEEVLEKVKEKIEAKAPIKEKLEVEIEIEEAAVLTNMETILKAIKQKSKLVMKINKYDGITLECFTASGSDTKEAIKEINQICKELKLLPISTEPNKEAENIFALQFPELDIIYSDRQIEKMYQDNFKWLIDGIVEYDNDKKLNREVLIKNKDIFVKQAILTYGRSNINPYKVDILERLNNIDYRKQIDVIYLNYIDKYIMEEKNG